MTYSSAQIFFHWVTVGLLAVMAATGLAYSFDLADGGAMWAHQIVGQTLIVILVLRLVTRFIRGAPDPLLSHAGATRVLAQTVHWALYFVLVGYVVTGYVSASGETQNALLAPVGLGFARSDTGEMFLDAHYNLKWVLLFFVTLHIAGALKHAFWDRDKTLSRIIPATLKGRNDA